MKLHHYFNLKVSLKAKKFLTNQSLVRTHFSLDLSSYALIYSCDREGGLGSVDAWILSRTNSLPGDVIADLKGLLASLGVEVGNMHATVQSDYYCPVA